jgi:hypothetical protein
MALAELLSPPGFVPHEASTWSAAHGVMFASAVCFTFEALTHIVPAVFGPLTADRIPARGKHHDVLDRQDLVYLTINRAMSVPFTYHYLRTAWVAPFMRWCAPLAARTRQRAGPRGARSAWGGIARCRKRGAARAGVVRWRVPQPRARRTPQPRSAAPLRPARPSRRADAATTQVRGGHERAQHAAPAAAAVFVL